MILGDLGWHHREMTVGDNVTALTAAMLRCLLEAVERGELEPDGEDLLCRLEGAAAALEAVAKNPR